MEKSLQVVVGLWWLHGMSLKPEASCFHLPSVQRRVTLKGISLSCLLGRAEEVHQARIAFIGSKDILPQHLSVEAETQQARCGLSRELVVAQINTVSMYAVFWICQLACSCLQHCAFCCKEAWLLPRTRGRLSRSAPRSSRASKLTVSSA